MSARRIDKARLAYQFPRKKMRGRSSRRPDIGDDDGQGRGGMTDNGQFCIKPIVANSSLRTLAYEALKAAITNMDIYGRPDEVRLDERKLSQDLGVSRTPVREALTVLEQEGFVRSEARRGVYAAEFGEDAEVVRAAKKRLTAARKEARTVLTLQSERLYEAMCASRTWPAAEWRELLAGAGVRSAAISGSGVFRDEATDETGAVNVAAELSGAGVARSVRTASGPAAGTRVLGADVRH